MFPRTVWHVTPEYTHTVAGRSTTPTVDTLAELLARIGQQLKRGQRTAGTVLLDEAMSARIGIDPGPWKATTPDYPWRTCRADGLTIHIGQAQTVMSHEWPWGDSPVLGMEAWHALTGRPWSSSPGIVGQELMTDTIPDYRVTLKAVGDHKPRTALRRPVRRDDQSPTGATEPAWSPYAWRRPAPGEDDRCYLQGFDRRRAGLTAAGGALLAGDALTHTGPRQFDPKRAGWWCISCPTWEHPYMPHPAGPGARVYKRLWITTPTLSLIHDLAAAGKIDTPEIVETRTAPGRQFLQPWQQLLERTYQCEDILILELRLQIREAVKSVYNAAIGMLLKDDDRTLIRRRDWGAGIAGQKRASGWRRAWDIGNTHDLWPDAVDDDCWWYWRDDPDPYTMPGLNFQDVPGGYRPHE